MLVVAGEAAYHRIFDGCTAKWLYTAPWTVRQVIDWRPDFSLLAEHDCEETSGSLEEARKYGYSLAPLP